MMKEHYDIWNIFHDGVITELAGVIPGAVEAHINISYLREMIEPKGSSFRLTLHDCTKFEYLVWDDRTYHTCDEIVERQAEVLSASETADGVQIQCVSGEINARYARVSCCLDTGGEVSFQELERACQTYWDEWERKHSE